MKELLGVMEMFYTLVGVMVIKGYYGLKISLNCSDYNTVY